MHLGVPAFLHTLTRPPVPAGPPTPGLALFSRLGTRKLRMSFGNTNSITSHLVLLKILLELVLRMIKREMLYLAHRVHPFVSFGSSLTSYLSSCFTPLCLPSSLPPFPFLLLVLLSSPPSPSSPPPSLPSSPASSPVSLSLFSVF